MTDKLGPDATLAEAKDWLRRRVDEGATCPCCHQFAKVYRRTMTASMAYALVLIYRHFTAAGPFATWLHVPTYLSNVAQWSVTVRGGDWAKLVHWGLIEERRDELREDGSSRTGWYRITSDGKLFVQRKLKVKKYVHIYDGQKLPREVPEEIDIADALRKKFNYEELMASI